MKSFGIQSESHVVRKEACPECRKLGNDKSGDNLAVYSDGHSYCYRCGYHTSRRNIATTSRRVTSELALPADVSTELPWEARQWLSKYRLVRLDIQRNHIMWSERWSRIIFPYFADGELLAWQGRYIGNESNKAKWFSQGPIHEILHGINVESRAAVLVEDIVSAIRVSKYAGAISIFGSSISTKQFLRIKTICDSIKIWLDPDMRQKSVKLAQTAKLLGLDCQVIFSDHDPKEETDEVIQEKLNVRLVE